METKKRQIINHLWTEGIKSLHDGKTDKAIDYFDKMISEKPINSLGWAWKGISFEGKGDYKECIRLCDIAINYNSKEYQAILSKARSLLKLNLNYESIICCDEVLKNIHSDPLTSDNYLSDRETNISALETKIENLEALGNFESALSCSDILTSINPGNPMSWCKKGVLCFRLGKFEEALMFFNIAIQMDPHEALFWGLKGQIEQKLDHRIDAKKSYQTFLSIAKNNPEYSLSKKESVRDATRQAIEDTKNALRELGD